MSAPSRFIVPEPFKHTRPERIRELAKQYGFDQRTPEGGKASEIWTKPDGSGGHWIIRMDAMGHDTRFHFGARPHYHKNWVESDQVLEQYLRRYTPQAWIYTDAGVVAGLAGGDQLHPDLKAKVQHIPR
jgi:hypothetical protein